MGYVRHHALLVTTYDPKYISEVREKAIELFGSLLSETNKSEWNGYHSFAVFPDGSVEFREQSNEYDEKRKEFENFLEKYRFEDGSSPYRWVEVQYGDEYGGTCIVSDSDHYLRDENDE